MELGSHRELDNPLLELFLNSCFSNIMILLRTAVETAVSGVHKLLGTGGVPTSLTVLIWRWLTVSSVFAGRSARTSHSSLTLPLFSPSLIRLMVSEDVKLHVHLPVGLVFSGYAGVL